MTHSPNLGSIHRSPQFVPADSHPLIDEEPITQQAPGNDPKTEQGPENLTDALRDKLKKLEDLQNENDAIHEGEDSVTAGETGEGALPDIDISQLNIPLNPIFDDHFDGTKPLFNMAKLLIGPYALQYKALFPTLGMLGHGLGLVNRDLIPGVFGLALTTGSAFFLKNKVEQLFFDETKHKSGLGWLASKTFNVAQIGLAAYSMGGSLGLLGGAYGIVKTAGLVATGISISAGLYKMFTSEGNAEEAQANKSVLKTAVNTAKIGAIAYGTIAGLGSSLGIGNLPGMGLLAQGIEAFASNTTLGSSLFTGLVNYVAQKPIEIALGLGLTLGGQILFFQIAGKAFQKLQEEFEKIGDSNKYGPYLEQLEAISQEEYHQIITKESGMHFEQIKEAFEPLRSRNPNHPENAAKPVIARLMVLNQEVFAEGGALQKYNQLVEQNDLKGADDFLNKELRAKLMTIIYLKHCLISPTRPQMGKLLQNASKPEYFSYLSHLVGETVKFPLEQVSPNNIQAETHQVLMQENDLQRKFYVFKEMQKQAFLNKLAEEQNKAQEAAS